MRRLSLGYLGGYQMESQLPFMREIEISLQKGQTEGPGMMEAKRDLKVIC